jgi:hypothetical protein
MDISRSSIPGMVNTDMPSADEVDAMTAQQRKVAENRLRRAAERQGLRLEKSRLRDPRALGYGTYQLTDERANTVVTADERGYGLDLHDVASYLYGDRDGR